MAHKPKIRFRLTEDRNVSEASVNGLTLNYQLSLADFGGERSVKLHWAAYFAAIDLEGEFELCLNFQAAENLAERLAKFLADNVTDEHERYV